MPRIVLIVTAWPLGRMMKSLAVSRLLLSSCCAARVCVLIAALMEDAIATRVTTVTVRARENARPYASPSKTAKIARIT
ncbi:hypothetical protein BDW74DRAFT_17997 [Aspergillus multicolor]|uniref:uncharacterized protein n=1 Tax=Aspergillus multicolor TaxID=41759 RepID=UPI003CCE2018